MNLSNISISANRVLKLVYENIIDSLIGEKIKLSRDALCLSGERFESEFKITHIENILFKTVFSFRKNNMVWILAKGKSLGEENKLKDYSRDLVLIPSVAKIGVGARKFDKLVLRAIDTSEMFFSSLFSTTSSGVLVCNQASKFGKKYFKFFDPDGDIVNYIIRIKKNRPMYSISIVEVISKQILEYLKKMK